jgi:hypothetical protein
MSERPPNCLVYTKRTITGVLQSFYTSNYFTQNQLEGGKCPLLLGLHLMTPKLRLVVPLWPPPVRLFLPHCLIRERISL